MEVVLRESELEDGWSTIPSGATWDEIEAAGVEVGLSSLRGGGLRVGLQPGDPAPGVLSHVGLRMGAEGLDEVRSRLGGPGCTVVMERADRLTFDDRHGVRWELATTDQVRSSGESLGRWVDLRQPRQHEPRPRNRASPRVSCE